MTSLQPTSESPGPADGDPAVTTGDGPTDDAGAGGPDGAGGRGGRLADRLRSPALRSDLAVGTAAGVVIFLLLLARNRWILQGPVYFGGDEGHQFATAWDAITMRELRGNGSRTGFHHPGPGYEYVWGAGELVRRALGRPLEVANMAMLATIALVAAQLGAVVAIVRAHLGTVLHGVIVVALVAVLASGEPGILAGPWLPHLFLSSLALMIVAGASVGAGRLPSLVAFVAGAGFLVHGHIAFTSFAGLATALVLVAMWRSRAFGRLWREERRTLWAAAGLLAAFLTPIVLSTLSDFPGEFDEYWAYMRRPDSGGNSLVDSLSFSVQYWPGPSRGLQAAALVGSLAVLGAVSWWRRSRFGAYVIVGVAAMQLALVQYVLTGVDDLSFRYVALFAYCFPGLALGTAAALAVPADWAEGHRGRRVVVALGTAAAVLAVTFLAPSTRYQPLDGFETPDLVAHLEEVADGRTIAIDAPYGEVGSFWLVPAVVGEAEDEGLDVCLENPEWVTKFSERRICDRAELDGAARFTFVPVERPLPPDLEARDPWLVHTAYVIDGPRTP